MTLGSATTTAAPQTITDTQVDSVVGRVSAYADSTLKPTALHTDRHGVTAARIEEFSDLRLLNHLSTPKFGGAGIGRNDDRRLHEIISGACLNTWLVWAQHAPMVGKLADAHTAGNPLPELAYEILRGHVLVGAAISDVRRFPEHFISATHRRGSWTFSGTVSWVSGWGLNTVLTVAAVQESTRTVVTALVPITADIRPIGLGLSAVHGSRTQRVELHDVVVPDEYVIDRAPLSVYRSRDLGTASDARPHHFGLAETVLSELEHSQSGGQTVAEAWRPSIAQMRVDAYALSDAAREAADDRHRLAERLRAKIAIGDALSILTRALLVSRSGHGITFDDTAQLHARSALFLLVQGQSRDVREAQLNSLARGAAERTP